MDAELESKPKIVGFLCNWCCYAGADLCGVARYQYPPYVRVIRLMCSGRVDPAFVLRALSNGADGVFIGGCWPGECHYLTEGNYDVSAMVALLRKMLEQIGVSPERLRLEWVSASEGIRFADVMNEFAGALERLGPLGKGEGIEDGELRRRFEAVEQLIPYLKLVLAKKMNVPVRSPEHYSEHFTSQEFERLFEGLIADKLAVSRLVLLLRERPFSSPEICQRLGLDPSDGSRCLGLSTKQGLIRFDSDSGRYELG